ncbi:hypothetical protein BC835DRAFT_1419576 [Cytidiella melzeri]|nr:hypothetical protein BC835DRAFT_1419576 [Cytidiella melzeri]
MSLKRKLSLEFEESVAYSQHGNADLEAHAVKAAKRPNLLENANHNTDVAMSDAFPDDDQISALDITEHTQQHAYPPANTAYSKPYPEYSSPENSPTSSPFYPDFVLYACADQDRPPDATSRLMSPADYHSNQQTVDMETLELSFTRRQ